ncbi:MAG: hypothetical protein FWC47_10875, partial [Oscillospiraceae bacterium]|nr:hypothetical protein [Oscillospiraceae bacterium]
MSTYNIITTDNYSSVVAEYHSSSKRSTNYQSEAELEKDFIEKLTSQGYEYINIKSQSSLIANLRRQLELLNDYT